MLKALYAIAIAFLVVAFVGFGISAFYPEPRYPAYPNEVERTRSETAHPSRRRRSRSTSRRRRLTERISLPTT